jgi:hypothetical protein
VNETGFNVAGTLELESGAQLQQLSKYPAWPDVLDVLASPSSKISQLRSVSADEIFIISVISQLVEVIN